MNIKTPNKKLFESEQIQTFNPEQTPLKNNDSAIESVFDVKSKQFKFENGTFMGSISIDTGNMFGLKYHRENTNNFEEFISSVSNFLKSAETELTSLDIDNLKIEYNKK